MPVLNDVVFGGLISPSEIQVEIVLGEPSTGGDTPSIEVIEEVAGILSGMTQLTQGMSYVDVNFGAAQPTADWVLVGLSITNLADLTPLNLWPGVVTNKSTTGFRLQLNGLPDSANYFLHWSIRGAFGYYFTGPASGIVDVASTAFSVSLPPGSSLSGAVIITPHDGGAGGTFTPATVSLTVASPSATFTYTPSTDGTVAIGVTNNRGLSDPASKTYVVSLVAATTYTFSGPSSGEVDIESTDFTVELPTDTSVPSAVTITPDDSSDGVFTPTTVELTTSAPSATFTYTPASSGAKTISVTNDGGLTNPGNLTYTSTAPFEPTDIAGLKLWLKADAIVGLVDTDAVVTWPDSSGLGNDAAGIGTAGNHPAYRTNIVNGLPIVRMGLGFQAHSVLTTPLSLASGWTVFAVMKPTTVSDELCSFSDLAIGTCIGPTTAGSGYYSSNGLQIHSDSAVTSGWHVVSATSTPTFYIDGASQSLTPVGGTGALGTFAQIGYRYLNTASDGDIADLLFYEGVLGTTDRQAVEAYLTAKYGL